MLDRYRTFCAARLALPGTGFTPSFLAACVSAVAQFGCSATQHLACTLPAGTLRGGDPCIAAHDGVVMAEQCESGICNPVGEQGTCGTCAAPMPAGQQCMTTGGGFLMPCLQGEVCDVRLSPTGEVIGGTLHCIPRADKVGASCVTNVYGAVGCTDGRYPARTRARRARQ